MNATVALLVAPSLVAVIQTLRFISRLKMG